ncbi:hypothetical protein ACIRU8_44140 [Streptomyces sp. NPDC101175]|uniref:hypothetical protein n=1 Tax=Streptomyces sp. NPDC101175 TaxID=3366123 RepID=UPI003837AC0E
MLVEGMWRATDLLWAYLTEDATRVRAGLDGLNGDQLEHTLCWRVLDHDKLFGDLGEPSMSVPLLDTVAALAPVESELGIALLVGRVQLSVW